MTRSAAHYNYVALLDKNHGDPATNAERDALFESIAAAANAHGFKVKRFSTSANYDRSIGLSAVRKLFDAADERERR